MAIYVVTGKLGGGKSLASIDRINDVLANGGRVATNLDLDLRHFPCMTRTSKNVSVVRVPDKPRLKDIESLGYGIKGVENDAQAKAAYDESKFGAIVLDECGTWLNSRDWQDEGRSELISYLLHIRKRLWNVYFIIQDISMLDKQARKALAEHVVYCRRTDRMRIPLISWLSSMFIKGGIRFPRMHIAQVRYGDQPTSLKVDTWVYRGDEYFNAYDTTQVFMDDDLAANYSLLPPWYHYRRTFAEKNLRFYMRLTRIYLKRHSRNMLLAAGVALGAVAMSVLTPSVQAPQAVAATPEPDTGGPGWLPGSDAVSVLGKPEPAKQPALSFRFQAAYSTSTGDDIVLRDQEERTYNLMVLQGMGYSVVSLGACRWLVTRGETDTQYVSCADVERKDTL